MESGLLQEPKEKSWSRGSGASLTSDNRPPEEGARPEGRVNHKIVKHKVKSDFSGFTIPRLKEEKMAKFVGGYLVGGVGYFVPKGMKPLASFDAAAEAILGYEPRLVPSHHKFVVTGTKSETRVLDLEGTVCHEWSAPFVAKTDVYYSPGQ